MAIYRHQVIIHTADNVPANFATNTLYSQGADLDDATAAMNIFAEMFVDFTGLYSSFVAQNNHQIKVYDMADPEPRAPVQERLWNLGSTPSGAPLPSELAICLSFQADTESGQAQARRRGRIYLGPVAVATLDTGGRPTSSARTQIATAATTCLAAFEAADPPITWVVWSQVNGTASNITNGWVDNDFDVQRRRQQAVTARTVWT
jgi:hypothetical protein